MTETFDRPGVAVLLTPDELRFVALAGAMRRAGALDAALNDRYGNVDVDPWSIDIEGVAAELAVAKLLNRYYVPALRPQRGPERDVGAYEVRSTSHEDGCLLIKDGDRDDDYFILVVGRVPRLRVVGWLRARNGRRPEWRRNVRGREAFFVPQNALHTWPGVNR